MAIHLGRNLRSASCNQPGRLVRKPTGTGFPLPRRPYSVLLPVGFAVPLLLPRARCALTAPFHPYPWGPSPVREAVCFLWHCPWGRPRRRLSGTVLPWSPDFPPRLLRKTWDGAAIRPADTANKGCAASRVKSPAGDWLPAAKAYTPANDGPLVTAFW